MVKWRQGVVEDGGSSPDKSKYRFSIKTLKIGHKDGEFFIQLGDHVIILPPKSARELCKTLKVQIDEWEAEYGVIKDSRLKRQKTKESVPKKVLRNLYKSRKINRKLISINTRRKK